MSTKWADPLVGVSHVKRRYKTQKCWTEESKQKILALRSAGRTAEDIRRIMQDEHGFEATVSTYKRQFKLWKTRLHLNKKQRQFIIRERNRRGRMPVFKYIDTNEAVDPEKLESLWKNRSRYSGELSDGSPSPAGLRISVPPSPAACTPYDEMLIDVPGSSSTILLEQGQLKIPTDERNTAGKYRSLPEAMAIDDPKGAEDTEIELFRIVDNSHSADIDGPKWPRLNQCYASLDLTCRGHLEFFETVIAPDSHATVIMTDQEAELFIHRILKTLGIPVDYHLKNTRASPMLTFDDWERAQYGSLVCETNITMSPSLQLSPELMTSILNLDYHGLTTPGYEAPLEPFNGDFNSGFELHMSIEMPSEIYGDKVEPVKNLHRSHKNFANQLFGSQQEMEELRVASMLTRAEDDISIEEKELLVGAAENCLELLFQIQETFTWQDCSDLPDDSLDAIEEILDVYRRILGPVAPKTLSIERGLYRYFCIPRLRISGSEPFNTFRARATDMLRKHFAIYGASHWKTRDCLNILSEWIRITALNFHNESRLAYLEESLGYSKLALEFCGSDDKLQDSTALESKSLHALLMFKLGKLKGQEFDDIYIESFLQIYRGANGKYDKRLPKLPRTREMWEFPSEQVSIFIPKLEPRSAQQLLLEFSDIFGLKYGSDNDAKLLAEVYRSGNINDPLSHSYRNHTTYIRLPQPLDNWPTYKIVNYAENLERIGYFSVHNSDLTKGLQYYEQALNCKVMCLSGRKYSSYDMDIAITIERIIDAMMERGPVFYLQPLLYFYLEGLEKMYGSSSEEVLNIFNLYSKTIL